MSLRGVGLGSSAGNESNDSLNLRVEESVGARDLARLTENNTSGDALCEAHQPIEGDRPHQPNTEGTPVTGADTRGRSPAEQRQGLKGGTGSEREDIDSAAASYMRRGRQGGVSSASMEDLPTPAGTYEQMQDTDFTEGTRLLGDEAEILDHDIQVRCCFCTRRQRKQKRNSSAQRHLVSSIA